MPNKQDKNRQIENAKLSREMSIVQNSVNTETRTVELAYASETPYERWFGNEILDCIAGAVRVERLNKGANLLVDHDTRDVVGVIESHRIDADKVCRAVVRFGKSARAEEVYQDVLDGIRTNVSVGYLIHKATLIDTTEGMDTYRMTDWEPYEISLVSVPADATVGVGRSVGLPQTDEKQIQIQIQPNEDIQMTDKTTPAGADENTPATEPKPAAVQVVEKRNHAREIAQSAKLNPKLTDLAMRSIQEGKTLDEFQKEAVTLLDSGALRTADIGMDSKDLQRYSLARALNALANPQDAQAQKDAAFEWECSTTASRQLGKPAQGILVPYDIQKRDMANVGTPSAGGHTVATNLSSNYIDQLSDRLVVMGMGATMLDGLVGDMAIPRHLGGTTVSWVGESQEGEESAGTWDQIPLTPKTVTGFTDLSRKLLKQSSISIDAFCQAQLVKQVALGIQQALINGAGTNGVPMGILTALQASGKLPLGTNGAKPTYKDIVALETMVAAENADVGSLGYLTNAKVRGLLKTTEMFSTTNGAAVWNGGTMNGYTANITNAVPSNLTKGTGTNLSAILFGNWAELIIGLWGGLDLIVDPYSKSKQGSIRFVAHQDVDFAYSHLESFAAIVDAVTI